MGILARIAYLGAFAVIIAASWNVQKGQSESAKWSVMGALIAAVASLIVKALFATGDTRSISPPRLATNFRAMNTKAKVVPLLVIVAVLVAVVIVFRSLTVLSTALLIGAGAFAFLHRDEASDSRKLPWQTWLLAVVSVVLYLVDWLVLGN